MARRSGGSRPAPARSAPTQRRSASTAAIPAQHQAPPHQANTYSQPAQQKQPGMFAQMASTAAGVAVGSTIGHTLGAGITSMFGGSSQPAEQQQPQQNVDQFGQQQSLQQQGAAVCDVDARNFTRCLGDNDGNMQICDFYLQQLKACQEASRQY